MKSTATLAATFTLATAVLASLVAAPACAGAAARHPTTTAATVKEVASGVVNFMVLPSYLAGGGA